MLLSSSIASRSSTPYQDDPNDHTKEPFLPHIPSPTRYSSGRHSFSNFEKFELENPVKRKRERRVVYLTAIAIIFFLLSMIGGYNYNKNKLASQSVETKWPNGLEGFDRVLFFGDSYSGQFPTLHRSTHT
jgi:hypothetical protein